MRAVFLDKDGTLLEDVPYNIDPARMRLSDGAPEALRRLRGAGYGLVVVSNQSGVARGFFTLPELKEVERHLRELVQRECGVDILDVIVCPHHPDGMVAPYSVTCGCRKPAPGMLLAAALRHRIRLTSSWMVGDILDDVEAGRRAGCRSILLNPGGETEWRMSAARRPEAVASGLPHAADLILDASMDRHAHVALSPAHRPPRPSGVEGRMRHA